MTPKILNGEAIALSEKSEMHLHWDRKTLQLYATTLTSTSFSRLEIERASAAMKHTFRSPSRQDYRDKFLHQQKPAHRVATNEWWSFGILQPFGAVNHHINTPNYWMFTDEGDLCMGDFDMPYQGWE
jgi:hypothetical protein